MPSGSAGLRKRRRKSLEGSQQPLQVGDLGREEPGHSAGEGGPSAKTLWHRPQSGPALAPPTLTVLGQSLDPSRKSPIVGTGGGRADLNGQRGLKGHF